ncbi:hypothetical protein OB236_32280 [Paenibacillus sp. WQ 127069]|uniref:Apea-like HEPN domain-containing protein n=1 Tax=Paenibacillus baimaensis TaxID=2982185 RepID=A0ABT2UQ74_9BACL|nr:hypothetical protein [Paenibacillus sp. WQ 127069]MCU6796813.1 hypothetical protein [Paenibacillus sp. WQ 127069]
MKALIPIDNFNIEKPFILGGINFIPASEYQNVMLKQKNMAIPKLVITDKLSAYEYTDESLRDLGSILTGIQIEDVWSMTVAVIELNWSDTGYYSNNKREDEKMLMDACNVVDRVLDVVRVSFSRMDNPLMNPGIPGLLRTGYSGMIIINPDTENEYRIVGSRLYGLTMVSGIGLDLNNDNIDSLVEDEFISVLECDDGNYVSLLSKLALKRLSEAMYIPLIDSKFIYLMTTIETLASQQYLPFKKVKPRIIPLLVNTKEQYHSMSEELRIFSEDIRTEIVHNGKSLTDIQNNEYKKILLKLQSIIARLALALYKSNCSTEEELDNYRQQKMENMGII